MDRLLKNLVELNEIILTNAPKTFGLPSDPMKPEKSEDQAEFMAAFKSVRSALTAGTLEADSAPGPSSALDEENVSGQRRYRIQMTKPPR